MTLECCLDVEFLLSFSVLENNVAKIVFEGEEEVEENVDPEVDIHDRINRIPNALRLCHIYTFL